jgi:hypothetical protein
VQRHRDAATGRDHHRDAADLRRPHHGPHVVLAEDPLDRDRVRGVHAEPGVHHLLDLEQPQRGGHVGRGLHDADLQHAERSADGPLHDAEAAPGQARVDSEHTHERLLAGRSSSGSEHLF